MRFSATSLPGAYRVELEPLEDARGFFARTWCEREADAHGLVAHMVQDSVAHNVSAGTLRGMHFHDAGFPQVRVMRCIAGSVHVVMLDLRPDSAGYLTHCAVTLDGALLAGLYVPPGVALGYQTLADATTVYYQMPLHYDPVQERGVRWNDPAFGIVWPGVPAVISSRDAHYPDFDPASVAAHSVAGPPQPFA